MSAPRIRPRIEFFGFVGPILQPASDHDEVEAIAIFRLGALTPAEPRSTIVTTRSQQGRPTMRVTLAEAKVDRRAIEKDLGAR
jgi:hypothetical protein